MIYEYKCSACGEISEVWAKISDPAPESCPKCAARGQLERVISATTFALKGSGWYTTDYKRASGASTEAGAQA